MINPNVNDQIFQVWCAAWVDTEGFIGMRHSPDKYCKRGYKLYRIIVGVVQKDPRPLQLLKKAFGGSISNPYHQRTTYQWQIHSQSAYKFLKIITPYLIIKEKQATLAIQAASIISDNRGNRFHPRPQEITDILESIKNELHILNGWSNQRRADTSRRSKGKSGARPTGKWSIEHDSCIECGRNDLRHLGHGLCATCYARHWRANDTIIISRLSQATLPDDVTQ